MHPSTPVDVAIIGGGFAGLFTAITLASLDLRILLVDRGPPPDQKQDRRAIALNHSSQQRLLRYHLWSALHPHSSAIRRVHVSTHGTFHKLHFNAAEYGLDALGYVVEGKRLATTLYTAVTQTPQVQCHYHHTATLAHDQRTLTLHPTEQTAHPSSPQTVHYQLLIACDGSHSQTAQQLGLATHHRPPSQQALLRYVSLTHPHHQTAFERFTDQGTFALLPSGTQRYKLVITASPTTLASWQSACDAELLARLQHYFGSLAGTFCQLSPAITYPIITAHAKQHAIDGALLVGNAAHSLSPLAAQGLNLTLRDITALTQHLQLARSTQEDWASLAVLKRYLRARCHDQHTVRHLTTLLEHDSPFPSLWRCGRQLALAACQYWSPLHHAVARRLR